MKNVKRAIEVSGRPIPVTPFTKPEIKKDYKKNNVKYIIVSE